MLPNLYKLDEDNVTPEERALVQTGMDIEVKDPVAKNLDFENFEIPEKLAQNDIISSSKNLSKNNLKNNAMNVLTSKPEKSKELPAKQKKANKWNMRRQGSSVSEKTLNSDKFEDQLEKLEKGQSRGVEPIPDVPMLRKSKTTKVDDKEDQEYAENRRWGKQKNSSGKSAKLKAIEILIGELGIAELQELYNSL